MGRIFVVDLEGRSYRCKFCKTQLALADELISRAFHCRRGKAYLFNNVRPPTRRARNINKGNLLLREMESQTERIPNSASPFYERVKMKIWLWFICICR
ncbi:protein yippee-like At5g53940 isoform X2 [Salvia miltiorrhiza]|uniref:protein yippee-like At5g53940 isoform X2 n=1 Tax=Salvia miltiorrhiza TaxID=226208 RepID=UPI0025AD28D2|nr:protein yippee-like At5g53940 isoform X2 [Salvia miltiorrhiza]